MGDFSGIEKGIHKKITQCMYVYYIRLMCTSMGIRTSVVLVN